MMNALILLQNANLKKRYTNFSHPVGKGFKIIITIVIMVSR